MAQLLNDEMIDHFRNVAEVPHSSRLVIRIFADLKEVSHMAIKAKLVDPNGHPRVLAPFAASFNAVSPYFDFVDVSDKHNVKVKVSGKCPLPELSLSEAAQSVPAYSLKYKKTSL